MKAFISNLTLTAVVAVYIAATAASIRPEALLTGTTIPLPVFQVSADLRLFTAGSCLLMILLHAACLFQAAAVRKLTEPSSTDGESRLEMSAVIVGQGAIEVVWQRTFVMVIGRLFLLFGTPICLSLLAAAVLPAKDVSLNWIIRATTLISLVISSACLKALVKSRVFRGLASGVIFCAALGVVGLVQFPYDGLHLIRSTMNNVLKSMGARRLSSVIIAPGANVVPSSFDRSAFARLSQYQVAAKYRVNVRASGIDLRKRDLRGCDFRDAVLIGADLRKSDLSGADLRGADLRLAMLTGAKLKGTLLEGADLSASDCSDVDFTEASLGETKFQGSQLSGAMLDNCSLMLCDFQGALLSDTRFAGADLFLARFDGSDGNGTIFRDANLTMTSFCGAHMRFADFARAALGEADFRSADMEYCQFNGADLDSIDGTAASIWNCNLDGADLRNAIMKLTLIAAEATPGFASGRSYQVSESAPETVMRPYRGKSLRELGQSGCWLLGGITKGYPQPSKVRSRAESFLADRLAIEIAICVDNPWILIQKLHPEHLTAQYSSSRLVQEIRLKKPHAYEELLSQLGAEDAALLHYLAQTRSSPYDEVSFLLQKDEN